MMLYTELCGNPSFTLNCSNFGMMLCDKATLAKQMNRSSSCDWIRFFGSTTKYSQSVNALQKLKKDKLKTGYR
jgi:hypothetical protein